jgi:hypothetical protein
MREPLIDPILGRLTWDEPMGSWYGEVELFPGYRIEVCIDVDGTCGSQEIILSQAYAWVARLREREAEYRRWIAEQAVNGRWNTDEPMTTEDIEKLLRVALLLCETDGSARVYWDDDGVLYCDHGFCTKLDASGTCLEVRGN